MTQNTEDLNLRNSAGLCREREAAKASRLCMADWFCPRTLFAVLLGMAAMLSGCTATMAPDSNGDDQGNVNGSPDTDPDPAVAENVETSLRQLGVDTTETPRIDEMGDDLPADYSPLGSSSKLATTAELFMVGLQLEVTDPTGAAEILENRATLVELSDDETGNVGLTLREAIPPDEVVWDEDTSSGHPSFGSASNGSYSTRDVAAGDLDADGLDEIIVVFAEPESPAKEGQILLHIRDSDGNAGVDEEVLAVRENLANLTVTAGDFDGDGSDEFVIAATTDAGVELLWAMRDGSGSWIIDETSTLIFERQLESGFISAELAAGALDYDNPDELAIIINEGGSGDANNSTYWVLDDATTGYEPLEDNRTVLAQVDGVRVALAADIALGDVDADGLDEIFIGGLTEFPNGGCDSIEHLHILLDDAENGLGQLDANIIDDGYVGSGTGCSNVTNRIEVRKVFVNAFDADGDGIDELHANRRVFKYTADEGLIEWQFLPYTAFLGETDTSGGLMSDATASIVTADVTGDEREDIIVYVQWIDAISVWGLNGPSDTWEEIINLPTQFANGQTRVFPIITPADVDVDGVALKYSDGEYRFLLTQPIIIAALAAAPCRSDIGQNTDACVTSFGQAESQDLGIDGTVTIRASTWVGGEAKIFGIGSEVKQTITRSASFSAGRTYTLEETIEYTTGPIEDTVVFTTLPVDQYTYTVVSHPDPDVVGEKIVVNMPRSPITLQVERGFYNANVPDGAFQVDDSVFKHVPGDPSSYPTQDAAEVLIDTGGLAFLGAAGELVDAAGAALGPIAETLLGNGLMAGRTTTVGQGGGQTSTEIRFSEQTSYRAGAEISYEVSAETTAGVVVGGSIGGSIEAGLSWGNGSSTVYRGTVGSIAADSFSSNIYNFGLFTYIYNYGDSSKPQFEVVTYWVE